MMRHRHMMLTAQQLAKAQTSSLVATACDFGMTALLFSLMPRHLAWCTFLGALTGGAVNCVINYHWTFRGNRQKYSVIIFRYSVVWAGSIFLNTWGTVYGVRLVTQCVPRGLDTLLIVKAVVAVIVAVGWNFLLQKIYVYKRRKKPIKEHESV